MSGDTYAILVGISAYQRVQSLPCGSSDALAIRSALIDVGISSSRIVTICDDEEEQPTLESILERVADVGAMQLDPDDTILFYFSGHGAYDQADYLFPTGASLRILQRTAIRVEEVFAELLKSGSRQIIMLIDACRDELPPSKAPVGIGLQTADAIQSLDRQSQGVAILFSCRAHERSYVISDESGPRSSFTKCLIDAVRSPDHVTLSQVAAYLEDAVPTLNQLHHKQLQKPHLLMVPKSLAQLALFGNPNALSSEVQSIVSELDAFVNDLGPEVYSQVLSYIDSPRWWTDQGHAKRYSVEWLCSRQITPETFLKNWAIYAKMPKPTPVSRAMLRGAEASQ